MSILTIVEVSAKRPYLHFGLELSEHTNFSFNLFLSKQTLIKLRIISSEFNDRTVLWKKKLNDNDLWSIFYYRKKSFYYQNGYQLTKIELTDDHLDVIDNFILSHQYLPYKKRKCIRRRLRFSRKS